MNVAIGTGSTGGGIGSGSSGRLDAGLRTGAGVGLRWTRAALGFFFGADGLAVRVLIFAFFTYRLPDLYNHASVDYTNKNFV